MNDPIALAFLFNKNKIPNSLICHHCLSISLRMRCSTLIQRHINHIAHDFLEVDEKFNNILIRYNCLGNSMKRNNFSKEEFSIMDAS